MPPSRRCPLVALLIVLALASAGSAQPEPQLGSIQFPTSGSTAAQAHFLKGVAWLHSFGYIDAMDEFELAQKLDPGFAMAYWGEAMANNQSIWYTQDTEAARRVLARLAPTPAARAARAHTPREKAYLAAVELLFGPGDKRARDLAYLNAMQRLAAAYPDDDEAAVFYALALLATQGRAAIVEETRLKAGAIAEAVFKRNPNHPGAAHVVIHAYDDGTHARRALGAARSYSKIAPAASHALHMPSHIFLQLGLWDEAAASDEASFAASDAWVRRKGLGLASRDYHSLSWLQYEYLQQGRYQKAKEAMKPLEEALKEKLGGITPEGSHSHLNSEDSSEGRGVRLLASMRARYVIETRRFVEMTGQPSFDNVDELFAVGMSAAVLGDFPRADETLTFLQREMSVEQGFQKSLDSVMAQQMDGMITLARGQSAEGVRVLQNAAAIEDPFPGPVGLPFPVKRSRELLGEVLLGMGRAQEAAEQFQLSLNRTANRALSVLGLARAQARLGNQKAAREQYGRFLAIWHEADPDLQELQEARAAVGLPATSGLPVASVGKTAAAVPASEPSPVVDAPIIRRLALMIPAIGLMAAAIVWVSRRRAAARRANATSSGQSRRDRRRQAREAPRLKR